MEITIKNYNAGEGVELVEYKNVCDFAFDNDAWFLIIKHIDGTLNYVKTDQVLEMEVYNQ